MKNMVHAFIIMGMLLIQMSVSEARLDAQGTPFTVVSPAEGQSVTAGGTAQLVLSPAAGLTVTDVQVWSPIGNYLQHSGAPITLSIPNNILGPVTLKVLGQTSDGSRASVNRTVQVTTNQTLRQITLSPAVVRLVAPGTVNGLSQTQLTITGFYSDGISRDISHLPQALIKSDAETVATVDFGGLVTAVAPGQTSINVTVGSIIGNARVQVNVFELKGDLDGDGDVDQDDLNILLSGLNTLATGPGDPRDLNNDGKIDTLDSQILATLCSRLACATSLDTTPPVIVPQVSGTLGNNGWYRSNVAVSWSVTDPESGIVSSTGCDVTNLTAETASVTLTCSATNGAGLSTSVPLTLKIDKTPPVFSGMPAPGCSLWPPNGKMVQVATVTARDALAGLAPDSFQVTGTSNEPPSTQEISITPNGSGGYVVQLQARRLGNEIGRVYTLTATANDLAGNTATASATCAVPHDQRQ